jgi:phage gp36-like protein
MASYASASDMLTRYDPRPIGDLVKDDGSRASPSTLLNDPVLAAALQDASGLVDSATLVGGRYSPGDLAGLAPTDNTTLFLKRLVCDLAYGLLISRRGYSRADQLAQAPNYQEALALLEKLRAGELIFDIPDVINAGRVQNVVLSKQIFLISSIVRIFGDLSVAPSNLPFTP